MGNNVNRKIVRVNDNMGIKGISKQQGTTRYIYDALPISNATSGKTLKFFEGVANRNFPFTNLNQNKLNVGESLALQRFSLCLLGTDATTGNVTSVLPIDNLAAGTNALYRSDMTITIAQTEVITKLPIHTMYAPFNKKSQFYGQVLVNPGEPTQIANLGIPHDVFHFDNDVIVPQQLEFVCALELPSYNLNLATGQNFFMMLTLEGFGSLFAPKATF
jgi:hypothetical protein